MASEFDYVSVQLLQADGGRERFTQPGRPTAERAVALATSHLELEPKGGALFYEVVRAAVRAMVRAVYLFPILLVVKIVLWALDSWYSDLVTIAFVLLVVALFASLSLLILLHLLVGPRSVRDKRARLRFSPPNRLDAQAGAAPLPAATEPEALARITSGEDRAQYRAVRLSGRIDAGAGAIEGEAVWQDAWEETEEGMVRTFWGSRFAVVKSGQPPVIVELGATPLVFGRYERDRDGPLPGPVAGAIAAARKELALTPSAGERHSCTLRHGDAVELVGHEVVPLPNVADVPLGSRMLKLGPAEGGPYRAGEAIPGLLVSGTPLMVERTG